MTKYLLLDIDGVLTNARDFMVKGKFPRELIEDHRPLFCASSLNLINRLVSQGGLNVIVFSTWAVRFTAQEFAEYFNLPVVDVIDPGRVRPLAVAQWLESNPQVGQNDFIVFDDDASLKHSHVSDNGILVHTQCIHVNRAYGILISDIDDAAEKLGIAYVKWPRIFF